MTICIHCGDEEAPHHERRVHPGEVVIKPNGKYHQTPLMTILSNLYPRNYHLYHQAHGELSLLMPFLPRKTPTRE